ncbi:aminotransferase [Aspergillus terreus]|uniref:Aminotransferase n=1 Tax=Aspergillus terreus TaxID=33178 RepID=A0A5M3Z3H3_ASPTE|nr:hypothetical protein ATETN484_0008047100 [Aspergillus terreus]GFF21299.1 aminotransferase [Aspergillus terreus]
MAQTTALPQHVTALLSHLTSRPGVQSTFILSRKDGSIIQCTGLLSSPSGTSTPNTAPTDSPSDTSNQLPPTPNSTAYAAGATPSSTAPTSTPSSQAQTLAAQVFAFVSSASELSMSLSRPAAAGEAQGSNGEANGVSAGSREDAEGEASEKEDDDEVKLLRLRTKKHEIVVVPDRKYLLCVVHDATHSAGGSGGAGIRSSSVYTYEMSFDLAAARSRFPALNQEQVFLDNAGGSQVLDTVIQSITEYLSGCNVQLGATYKTSKASTAAYDEGYAAAARFINARSEEICLGASTTQLLHNLSTALKFQPGDEVIVSKLNHEANSAPWVRIAERLGLQMKFWSARDPVHAVCDPDDLKPLLSEKTRLVACPHTSNLLGSIVDVKAIARLVHQFPRALLCVDGVALAPHRQVDVKDLDVDFYAFSWYKVYGPHIAQLYASARVHDQIDSLGHFFKATDTLDLKLNLASANYELTQSIPRVVEYFGSDIAGAWKAIAAHEEKLQGILLGFLNSHERITVYGETSASRELRVPVISFTVRGAKSQRVVEEVEKRSPFGFRSGHMYSLRLVKDIMGLEDPDDGVVRISMLHYNTEEEISSLVQVLKEVVDSV